MFVCDLAIIITFYAGIIYCMTVTNYNTLKFMTVKRVWSVNFFLSKYVLFLLFSFLRERNKYNKYLYYNKIYSCLSFIVLLSLVDILIFLPCKGLTGPFENN